MIMSYDYLDYDVYWNAKLFYRALGYEVRLGGDTSGVDLLVVLRGNPRGVDPVFNGEVHVYHYVAEPQAACSQEFPNASRIILISLIRPNDLPPDVIYVKGYLPVIPELWCVRQPQPARQEQPVHISNFKEIGTDHYQDELLELARQGDLLVYGSGWSRHGVETGRISHWQANTILARSPWCYGFMYPHQRGVTLSGRMWQAPLHGCFVISELGTNITRAPGVIEACSFLEPPFPCGLPADSRERLRREASAFWIHATDRLARELGFVDRAGSSPLRPSRWMILQSRGEMLSLHLTTLLSRERNRLRAWRQILWQVMGRYLRGDRRTAP